jgi:hypothetical protein
MGLLMNLEFLLLFDNQLSGLIPAELGDLTKLSTFEVELNVLAGAMPSTVCENRVSGSLAFVGADCLSNVTCASSCCDCCDSECFPDDSSS